MLRFLTLTFCQTKNNINTQWIIAEAIKAIRNLLTIEGFYFK